METSFDPPFSKQGFLGENGLKFHSETRIRRKRQQWRRAWFKDCDEQRSPTENSDDTVHNGNDEENCARKESDGRQVAATRAK